MYASIIRVQTIKAEAAYVNARLDNYLRIVINDFGTWQRSMARVV